MANPSSEALCAVCGRVIGEDYGRCRYPAESRDCYRAGVERQRAEVARLRNVIAKAPHEFGCLSSRFNRDAAAAKKEGLQFFWTGIPGHWEPPDEEHCNCWKRAALAAPTAPAKVGEPGEVPAALEWRDDDGHAEADTGVVGINIERDPIDVADENGPTAWFIFIGEHDGFETLDAAKAEAERVCRSAGLLPAMAPEALDWRQNTKSETLWVAEAGPHLHVTASLDSERFTCVSVHGPTEPEAKAEAERIARAAGLLGKSI